MTKALKWVLSHEPLITAGIIFGLGTFFALRYGTDASTQVQGQWAGIIALGFGFVRNFVTPSARQAVDTGQANLPAIASDVSGLLNAVGGLKDHPGGIVGFVEGHIGSVRKELEDLVGREKSVVTFDQPTTEGAPVTVSEAPTPTPDAVAELAHLIA